VIAVGAVGIFVAITTFFLGADRPAESSSLIEDRLARIEAKLDALAGDRVHYRDDRPDIG